MLRRSFGSGRLLRTCGTNGDGEGQTTDDDEFQLAG
jgi:hypothetical protein